MAEEQQATEITYTPEELETIRELTSFFDKGPGQVVSEEAPPTEDVAPLAPTEREAPKRPTTDLSKFEDVLKMDLDSFEATPQDEALDVPLADSTATEEPMAETVGEAVPDFVPTAEPTPEPTPPARDLALPEDLVLPQEAAPAEPTLPEDLALPEGDQALPEGLTDLATEPAAEPQQPALVLDIPAEPVAETPSDLGLPETPDLGVAETTPPAAGETEPDFGADISLPQGTDLDLAPPGEQTPDLADFTPQPPRAEAFDLDSAAPSLDELSPDVAVGAASSLSADLSSLAAEHEATLDPETLRRVRDTLRAFPAALRRRLSRALLDGDIKATDSSELLRLLAEGASANEISAWLESRGIAEAPEVEEEEEGPRVIVARPEYTEEALARQERLLKLTRLGAIAGFVLIVLIGGLYFSILKPYFYRQVVAKGRDLILQKGAVGIAEAERQFEKALSYYPTDSYAFLQYADAYRYKGLYAEAFAKLFAELSLPPGQPTVQVAGREVRSAAEVFSVLKRVPVVRYGTSERVLRINNTELSMSKKGAYVITHLDNKRDEAQVLLALGAFHGNPSRRFAREPYKNNLLAADYYRRVLMANPATPMFKKEEMLDRAVMGLGDLFYHEKEYDRALDYYKKILDKNPLSVVAHTGIMKALLKLAQLNRDPRMVIQHHTLIRNNKLENKLPMYLKARLAAFYIDLPAGDALRVRYNIPPKSLLTGEELKSRADELLNSIFSSSEKDIFGNTIEGTRFAEGYYQRARFFAKDKNQPRMALKQFEYAFHYDPRHFMALNDRAEVLMSLGDFMGAAELLRMAKSLSTPEKLAELGENEADETLAEAPVGVIAFNLGKAMYLDTIRDLADSATWFRLKEVQKYRSQSDQGLAALLAQLDRIEQEFREAQEKGLPKEYETELLYFSGWSKYVRNDHRGALSDWEKIDAEKAAALPNLSLAQSHCYYRLAIEESNPAQRTKYLNTALGLLFFSHDRFTAKLKTIPHIDASNPTHARLISNLAMIENNIGAVYELLDDEERSLQHYWKSVENSKRIGKENEIANLNIRLSFKRKALGEGENYPVIMDYIPPRMSEEL